MLKSKASMRSQSQLPKVSTRFGLVLLEFHLGIKKLGIIYITIRNLNYYSLNREVGADIFFKLM